MLSAPELQAIEHAGALRFHCVGDTGGFGNPIPQRAVAAAMATELAGARPVSFFYHLGDIVYLYGEETNYGPQFLQPYGGYDSPILGVAGNHDGDLAPGSVASTLEGFVGQFCAPASLLPARATSPPSVDLAGARAPQHQPNVYWTLEHTWVTIIGLYTGVAEGGQLDHEQSRWLIGELRSARPDVTLILAMHHPVYSADSEHGSNLNLGDALDGCFASAGRAPDAVFSAHAHNYQRFTRTREGREIPYVVAGTGGFHELHSLGYGVPNTPASFAALPDLTLEACQHGAYGFMTVSAGPDGVQVDYNIVVRRRPAPHDSFRIVPAAAGVLPPATR